MAALAPYAEKVISDYLREDPGVAALVDRRVVGKTPASTDNPWVRVTELDDRAVGGSRSDHLHEFYFQFDCYAGKDGGQPEANLLKRTVRKALVEMSEADHEGAVVSGVDIRGSARLPDDDVDEPARERFVLTANVWMHS